MLEQEDVVLGVSDFVAILNGVLEYALTSVVIVGELANLRVSRGKWVYFDLKDEGASVKFFGTVYQLPGPLEDGMKLRVRGVPRLHPLYGFSVNVLSMTPEGEGAIKKASDLLKAKLEAEGLFAPERKRLLPFPPRTIGLVASSESAAYKDFIKVLNARWGGLKIMLIDVLVQGEQAAEQVSGAIQRFSQMSIGPDVIVVTRGGGSAEDLAAFSTEQVVRAVAASRIPTMIAIGHEIDISLAELAADQRASTPSNAAELLVPDRKQAAKTLKGTENELRSVLRSRLASEKKVLSLVLDDLAYRLRELQEAHLSRLAARQKFLDLLNPGAVLRRGYALVRDADGNIVRSRKVLSNLRTISIELSDGKTTIGVK